MWNRWFPLITRWWQLKYFWNFYPYYLGKINSANLTWQHIFASDGLGNSQPPTTSRLRRGGNLWGFTLYQTTRRVETCRVEVVPTNARRRPIGYSRVRSIKVKGMKQLGLGDAWKRRFVISGVMATRNGPVHPGRLTWNLQITHFERKMIFQTSMIMFHLNLQGCMAWKPGFCNEKRAPCCFRLYRGNYTSLCYRVYYIPLWESILNSQYNGK